MGSAPNRTHRYCINLADSDSPPPPREPCVIHTAISRAYFGRNLFANGPAAYLTIDLDGDAALRSGEFPSLFRSRLDDLAAALELQPDADFRSHPLDLASVIEQAAEWACRRVGARLSGIRRIEHPEANRIELILCSDDAETARRAGLWGVSLMRLLLEAPRDADAFRVGTGELLAQLHALGEFAASRRPSPTGAAMISAAWERDVPVIHLDRAPLVDESAEPPLARRGLMQFGWGIHARQVRETATDAVPEQIYALLNDREWAQEHLMRSGVAVPRRGTELQNTNSARRAARHASRIGYPVTIRPRYRAEGQGHSAPAALADGNGVVHAFEELRNQGVRQVLVEPQVPGPRFRVLVIGDEAVRSVCVPTPAGGNPAAAPEPVELPMALQRTAVRAAKSLRLPIAEVEIIGDAHHGRDGGVVVDLDPAPNLTPFALDGEELPLTVARRFLAQILPDNGTGRIPTCAITGTNGKTTTSRMVAKVLAQAGRRVGLACTDGIYIDGKAVRMATASGISGAVTLFLQRNVDFAVLETSRGTLAQRGLAFERCDVAACINIASDHLEEDGIETLEELARLKRVVVEAASRCAVLNGEDPRCVAMLPFVTAKEVVLVSTTAGSADLDAHLARGGRAVVVHTSPEGRTITLHERGGTTPIVAVEEIPATWKGAAAHNVENATFATALALGLGIEPPIIRAALRGFTSSIDESPGRINVYTKLPFSVVLDFAHNPHGFRALCDFVATFRAARRKHLVVYWTRDPPRQADLRDAMSLVARAFDRFICREAAGWDAGSPVRVAHEVESALLSAGAPADGIRVIPKLEDAIESALRDAEPGDLVAIITGSKARQIWGQVDSYRVRLEEQQRRS